MDYYESKKRVTDLLNAWAENYYYNFYGTDPDDYPLLSRDGAIELVNNWLDDDADCVGIRDCVDALGTDVMNDLITSAFVDVIDDMCDYDLPPLERGFC